MNFFKKNTEQQEQEIADYTEIYQLEEKIKQEPEVERNYIHLFDLYKKSGNAKKAVNLYRDFADILIKQGELEKARCVLSVALHLIQDSGDIHVRLGYVNKKKKFYRDAKRHYTKALSYADRAKDVDSALYIWKELLDMEPEDMILAVQYTYFLVKNNLYNEAVGYLKPMIEQLKNRNMLQKHPILVKYFYEVSNNSVYAGLLYADVLLKNRTIDKCEELLGELIDQEPDNVTLLRKAIAFYKETGQTAMVQKIYDKMVQITGKEESFHKKDVAKKNHKSPEYYALSDDVDDSEVSITREIIIDIE